MLYEHNKHPDLSSMHLSSSSVSKFAQSHASLRQQVDIIMFLNFWSKTVAIDVSVNCADHAQGCEEKKMQCGTVDDP